MLKIEAEVDRASVAALSSALQRAQKEFGKSVEGAVTWAGHVAAKRGATISKPGKKMRPLQFKQASVGGRGVGKRIWFVEVWSQKQARAKEVIVGIGKRPTVKGNRSLQKIQTVERHGLSRKVWNAINGKIGGARRGGATGFASAVRHGRTVNANARVKRDFRPYNVALTLTNRLTYSESAYPGITNRIVADAARTLENRMDNNAENVAKSV